MKTRISVMMSGGMTMKTAKMRKAAKMRAPMADRDSQSQIMSFKMTKTTRTVMKMENICDMTDLFNQSNRIK